MAAWKGLLAVFENPIGISGKRRTAFASQVLLSYQGFMSDVKKENEEVDYVERTGEAVVQKYRKSRCEYITFEGVLSKIKAKQPTGSPSVGYIEQAATPIYNGKAKVSYMYTFLSDDTVDFGSLFTFLKNCSISAVRTLGI